MRRRGHPDSLIRRVVYENPIEFLGQSPEVPAAGPRGRRGGLMQVGDGLHLTYCTNIHPAVGWEAVQEACARTRRR